MKALEIARSEDSPLILLDSNNDSLLFEGRSLPEDVDSVYSPVIKWLDEYGKNPKSETKVDFKIDYFNTASMKKFISIVEELKKIKDSGKSKISINWYFDEADEDTLDAGKDLQDIVGLSFNMIKNVRQYS